ncbi:hypothetical protein niasHS_002782 [Heterodera schachtii]|uniref:RING-type domain-containing protein n=1 Tax=Heterodera schachtii TaxID=97005 RepID=A0ABD2K2F1_HETSC
MGQLLVAFRGAANGNGNNDNENAPTNPSAGLRRLFVLLSAFLPFGQQPANNLEQRNDNNQQGESAEMGRVRAGFGRRRRRHAPVPPDLSGSGEAGGRGSPSGANGGGSFFGSHFLMGGELYDSSKPEVFLFGDQQDLELLGSKSVKFPFSAKGVTDSIGVLNALVNVRKDSVKFTKVGRAGGGYSSGFYRLEFVFDCDVSCFVQIHFCAREQIDEQQPQLLQIVSRQPQFEHSERFHFPVGANQQFSHFTFKPHRYDMKMMHWDGGPFFPVVIEIRSVSDQFPEQVQTTLCSIERSNDQSAVLILKPMKQKLFSDGVLFLLQEIFGIENKEMETAPPALAEENGAECIICMANSRDTMILPCRHLCICNGCAETLRYKLNNCPICRSPFKALLKIKAMRNSLVGKGVGSDGSMTTTRIRHEPVTLIEAINGPFTSSAPPAPPLHSFAVGADTATAQFQQKQQQAESRDDGAEQAALNIRDDGEALHRTAPAAAMVARCRGSQIVTSTIVHPSPALSPFASVPNYQHHKMPPLVGPSQRAVVVSQQKRHQMAPMPNRREGSSRRDVVLIGGGEAMAGTAAVIDWLRGVKSPQQNEQMKMRNETMEQIEMGQLRSRKGSHSSAVFCPSSVDNSFVFGSRSPSLCRMDNNRHSHFSVPNSSYQSARSFATKYGGDRNTGQKQTVQRNGQRRHLGSSPNLVNLPFHSSGGAAEEGVKLRKRSETLATEWEGTERKRRPKGAEGRKGYGKRRSETMGDDWAGDEPAEMR